MQHLKARFLCVQVRVRMVGLDATVIVEGLDLVSLKLLEADVTTTLKPPSGPGQRQGMKVRVRIEDISLRDLQVSQKHEGLRIRWFCPLFFVARGDFGETAGQLERMRTANYGHEAGCEVFQAAAMFGLGAAWERRLSC